MNANSLTLPFLPGLSPRPEGLESHPGRALGAMLRSLWVPGLLSPAAGGEGRIGGLTARLAERRLSRSARRGQRIVLGTPELPYEPLTSGGASLAALRRFEGLAIIVTTRSSEILEELALLVELDRRHAVTVDVMVASLEADSADLEERLRTVSSLSSQGITTCLLLTDLPGLPLSRSDALSVRRLFEAARDHRAFDVAAVLEGEMEPDWERFLRYLRLEHGFPHAVTGRG